MSKIDVRRETRGNDIRIGIRLSQRRDADGTPSPNGGDAVFTLQFVDENALQINGILAEEETDDALLFMFGGLREVS